MSIDIFNAIAPRYDSTNHVLSLGMAMGWRKKLLNYLPPGDNLSVLDLATGTGDVAIMLARQARIFRVTGVDMAEGMLVLGREKVEKAMLASKVNLVCADATALDFPSGSFDAVTVAFGIRNFADPMKGLMESYRLIKPGGRLIILEFSVPGAAPQKMVHALYLRRIMPFVGMLLTGHKAAYDYLSSTVHAFPYGEQFCRIMRQAGFSHVEHCPLAMGSVTVYAATRQV